MGACTKIGAQATQKTHGLIINELWLGLWLVACWESMGKTGRADVWLF